ncbi:MAG: hypothetical protein HY322_09265 [Betaproteobacteria bacterium]|nr:hypothetical protein [Betaproteobacteria bacterium]
MLRASAVAEKIGIPTVSIIGSAFMKQAAVVCRGLGIPFALAEYPGAPMVDSDAELRAKVETNLLPAIIEGLTAVSGPAMGEALTEPEIGSVVFKGTLDEVQEHFHQNLWSDGLPVIPPTREWVDAFLKFTDRDPRDVIRALPQEGREASILSIAVNGVMAGCRPEYMPLLVAIVEAISDPNFRIEAAGSTPAWEPLVVVSGPIVEELDFNYGQGVLKVGRQANSSIGRFARLYMRNICGYRIPPGTGDKGSIGYTFNVALAEDEEWSRNIGWPTFSEDAGFGPGDNVVTVQSVVTSSPPTYSAGDTAIRHVQQFADVFVRAFSYGSHSGVKRGYWHPLVVIGPSIAKVIAREWTKDDVRRFLWKTMTIPASLMRHFCAQTAAQDMDFAKLVGEGTLPAHYAPSDDPDRPVPIIVKPEHIGILIAGDPGRNQSRGYMSNNAQGARTSRRVALPREWEKLRAQQRGPALAQR